MCDFSCVGFGNCTRVCPTGAITVVDHLAQVDPDKCIACGLCAAECPRGIISLLPKERNVTIECRSHNRGKDVRDTCEAGCIGCGLCVKKCKFGAIVLQDNLPVIDYDKCTGCMQCAQACPRHCISMDEENKKVAFINDSLCIGCSRCAKNCKFEAIEGEIRSPYKVDPEKCGNCSQCVSVCPKNAITMIKQ